MGNYPGSIHARRRSRARVIPFALMLAALIAFAATSIASARARRHCFGQTATIVGTNGADKISGTAHKNVIVARGGNDTIQARSTKVNHGNDIICAGRGADKVVGNPDNEKISGGPGNDVIAAGNGSDVVVGDNANVVGDESGTTGKDALAGSGAADFMVGDNLAAGDASGASPDDLKAAGGPDIVIGDDASTGTGDATGGADDRMGGASGNDTVIGDSYTVSGIAKGGGDDANNSGPGADLAVGDSYTKTGRAIGSGVDAVHAADGGDFNVTCKPANSCADVFYGDNYSASCGPAPTLAAIRCQAQSTTGGGPDLLTSDQGDDFMNGGPPDPDDVSGTGSSVDRCDGGTGFDTATRCKPIKSGFEREIPFP